MSSTNRNKCRKPNDYYITPIDKIKIFLNEFLKDEPEAITGETYILDPCAGGDENHPMSYPTALLNLNNKLTILSVDVREDSKADIKKDYLKIRFDNEPDVIITNPPFNIAMNIIKKGLNDLRENGYLIMLLRLNFFGSKSRYQFFQEYMPKYAYVHSKRLSFTENGVTDSIEYMHCVWQKGFNAKFTKLRVIE